MLRMKRNLFQVWGVRTGSDKNKKIIHAFLLFTSFSVVSLLLSVITQIN
jgi:hypothetical protein